MLVHHLDNLCYFQNFSGEQWFESVHHELLSPIVIFLCDESCLEIQVDCFPIYIRGLVDNDLAIHLEWSLIEEALCEVESYLQGFPDVIGVWR